MSQTFAHTAIVGAGPIGIELAVAFKRAGIDYIHFEARQIGHTVSWFAPQTRFFSSTERIAIAGVPLQTPDQTKCTREQYLTYLRSVVQQFELPIRVFEPLTNIQREAGGFVLTTCPGGQGGPPASYRVSKLVLATGGTERPRRLNIPGEDLPHVSHYFADPHQYFRRKLHIVGGKNSAVEAALRAHYAGAHVSLSHRQAQLDPARIKYWLMPEITGLIQSGQIPAHFNCTPQEIHRDHILLADQTGKQTPIPADVVLLLIGYEADMTLCRLAGVELQSPGQVPKFDPQTMETNIPGLYVAGTAIAGTQQRFAVFIENCHIHAQRIVASITGQAPPQPPTPPQQPES